MVLVGDMLPDVSHARFIDQKTAVSPLVGTT
jgi:hypothetical protein